MARTCLNPRCETRVPVIGVCVSCANSSYNPKRDGAGDYDVPDNPLEGLYDE